jgi:hypothetical protein
MADFSKIVIHYKEGEEERTAVIRRQGIVKAVFLQGSEKDLKSFANLERTKVTLPPRGVNVEPVQGLGLGEGPGAVCYLVDGILQCWEPD